MPHSDELLRETLLDLERLRQHEAEQRRETEWILNGLRALDQANSIDQMFAEVFAALAQVMGNEQALILQRRDDTLVPLRTTDPALLRTEWSPQTMLNRVLAGEIVASFDVATIPEWQTQPAAVRERVVSALHAPLLLDDHPALLVCTHSARGAFSRRQVGLLRRFLPLLQQALVNARAREQALRERDLRHQAELAQRESALKSRFLSTMSHELRTPLNAILGFAQLMETDPDFPLPEPHMDALQEIHTAGNHLLQLIDEVLDLGRIDAGRVEMEITEVDADDVIRECLRLLLPAAANKGIAIEYANRGDAATAAMVRADRFRLKQVLLNLINNAIKYNRPDGQVWVSCQPADDRWRISVRDTGLGLTAEQCEQVFEPFVRVSADRDEVEGTGMGLPIARRLMELMQGELRVDSQPGEGSDFWLKIPAA